MLWIMENRVTYDRYLFISLDKCMCVASDEALGLEEILFCSAILSH